MYLEMIFFCQWIQFVDWMCLLRRKLACPPNGTCWWSSTSRILIENPLASQADEKNDLGAEPILLIFIVKEMYFLLMNPTCTLDYWEENWPFHQKVLSDFAKIYLGGGQAPVGYSLRTPWPDKLTRKTNWS